MARYFPIFVDLQQKPCLVVGAGEIATHKAEQLLKYGAVLTIVAPEASSLVRQWDTAGRARYFARAFEPGDIDGQSMVVASTNDPAVNRRVYEEATSRGVPVNVVDVPELCSFVYGALVERGDLQIAISTSGRSPSFASHLRKQLESQFGEEYGLYLDILGEVRTRVRAQGPDMQKQREAFSRVLAADILPLIVEGRPDEARRRALACISPSSD